MTVNAKRNEINKYCDNRWEGGHLCSEDLDVPECPLYDSDSGDCGEDFNDDTINENYELLVKAGLIPVYPSNAVNHPSHYNQGGMECIDEMILVFGKSAVMNFCLCNAWKYRYRANAKNGQEDLDKANWYLNKYKELINNAEA